METIMRTLAPSATTQLRADHAHVLTTFHQWEIDTGAETKQVLVNSICRALEIHAQLEEDLFYPAVAGVAPALVDKNVHEHDDMRRLIGSLAASSPAHPDYDAMFLELMRNVIRHVSDEETVVFPQAERLLGDSLNEIGAHMAVMRVELLAPRVPEMAADTMRSFPASLVFAVAGVAIAGSYVLRHAFRR